MKKIKVLISAVLTLALLISHFIQNSVSAQQQNDFGIVVFPARQQIDVQPGEEKTIAISFMNQTLFPATGILGKADFIVKGDDNTPIFLEEGKLSGRYSAAEWIELPYKNMAIPAYDKTIVYIKIKIPENASPGGHYAAVFFEGTPSTPQATSEKEGTAVTAPRVAALLYFRVAGNIKEEAIVSKFLAPNFLEYGPIKVETSVLNKGDIHITPKGTIELYDMFGKLVDQSKLEEKNIFPGALTKYENDLGKKWMFGKYTIALKAGYGDKGKGLQAKRTIIVFPYRAVAVVLLAFGIFGYLIYHFYSVSIGRQKLLEAKLEEERKAIEELKQKLSQKEE